MEASALTGENVEEAFLKCAKSILAKIETGKYHFFVVSIKKPNFFLFL